jgi:hypothetical protein
MGFFYRILHSRFNHGLKHKNLVRFQVFTAKAVLHEDTICSVVDTDRLLDKLISSTIKMTMANLTTGAVSLSVSRSVSTRL